MEFVERLKQNVIGVLRSPVETFRYILKQERDLTIPAGIILSSAIIGGVGVYVQRRTMEVRHLPQAGRELYPWMDVFGQMSTRDLFLSSVLSGIMMFLFFISVLYAISKLLNGKATYKGFVELMAYTQIPSVIGGIAGIAMSLLSSSFFLIGLIFSLWTIGLQVIVIRESNEFSTKRAIAVFLIPVIIVIIIALAIFIPMMVGLMENPEFMKMFARAPR